jgi:hypothetical protein
VTTLTDLEARAATLSVYTDDRAVYLELAPHLWPSTLERRIADHEWVVEVFARSAEAGRPVLLGEMACTLGGE